MTTTHVLEHNKNEMIDFKQLRQQKKYTLRKVEEETSISNSYLSQLENGKIKNPSYEVVSKLKKLYGFDDVEIPVLFIDWLGEHYIKLHGGWVHKYCNQTKAVPKTTMEMYDVYETIKLSLTE